MKSEDIIRHLRSLANPPNVAGMARYGINPHNTLGVPMPVLRSLAKEVGKDHELALALWRSGVHEARILACLVDDPRQVTERQMEELVADFDSWDVCDQCCANLFDKTSLACRKTAEWSVRPEEFVRRAGFVLMAALAVHDKKAADAVFEAFLPMIKAAAKDERNFVKKAVNWALRQIGKRNSRLNSLAQTAARDIMTQDSRPARWIASDALRELTSPAVKDRLARPVVGTRNARRRADMAETAR
jgi:3-methyladenine DNA glycosylase AlkD